jgi:hypothetical protein
MPRLCSRSWRVRVVIVHGMLPIDDCLQNKVMHVVLVSNYCFTAIYVHNISCLRLSCFIVVHVHKICLISWIEMI